MTVNLLEKLLSIHQVCEIVGLSKSTIYAYCSAAPPLFPKPIKLGPGRVAWRLSDIVAWINERIAE